MLSLIDYAAASIHRKDEWVKHNTGVYVTDIPVNPILGFASIDYEEAEQLGYIKLDMLNVSVYEKVQNEAHLDKLMHTEPRWDMLDHKDFVEQVIHINNHYEAIFRMPEKVNSITRMAMLLAIIRPAKRHLVGKTWAEVAKEVWIKPTDGTYYFKKAHAISYAFLVAVHMNLLCGPTDQLD